MAKKKITFDDSDINWDVLTDLRAKSEVSKKPYEAAKAENRAALVGEQWVTYDYEKQSWLQVSPDTEYADEPDGEEKSKSRVVDNQLRQAEQQRIAECTGLLPHLTFIPRSPSQKHKIAAENAQKLWETKKDELKIRQKMRAVRLMADTDGEVYIWPYWDKTAGLQVEPPNGTDQTPKSLGDVAVQVIPDEQVFVEPGRKHLADANYVFIEFSMSVADLKEAYGLEDDDIGEMIIEPTSQFSEQEKLWRDLLGEFDIPEGVMYEDEKGKARQGGFAKVTHFMHKVNSKYPTGLHLVYTEYSTSYSPKRRKYKVLYKGGLELEGKYGFNLIEFWDGLKFSGRYYGDPDMNSARAIQHRLNLVETQLNRILKSSMPMVEASIEAFPADISREGNLGGYVQEHKGVKMILTSSALTGGQPAVRPLSNIDVPPQMYEEKAYCIQRINQVMGVDQIQAPTARQSAYGVQRSTTRLQTNVVEPQEEQLTEVAMWVIRLCKRYYTARREIEYLGDMRIPLALFISGDDIDFKTISVEPGSMMPSNKIRRQQEALAAWSGGLIPPTPANRRQVMRYVSEIDIFPDSNDYLNERNAQEENVTFLLQSKNQDTNTDLEDIKGQLEELRMKSKGQVTLGQQPTVLQEQVELPSDGYVLPDNDDHEIHIERHNAFILSSDVRNLPAEIRELLIDRINVHIELHKIALKSGHGFSEKQQQLREAINNQILMGQAGAAAKGNQPGAMPGVGGSPLNALGQPKPHERDTASGTPYEFQPTEQNPLTDFSTGQ